MASSGNRGAARHFCGSRDGWALSEEVAFDRAKVTSTDWLSYPILDITEAPEAVDIVLVNRPELPPAGAGESSIRPVAAALATPSSTPPVCACAARR